MGGVRGVERGKDPKGADDLCFFGKCDYKGMGLVVEIWTLWL